MKSDFYDLIVIGGGKGGKTFAMEQAKAGKRVAMVEKGMIGGSCINVACIPTKTMVASAKAFHLAKNWILLVLRRKMLGLSCKR